VTASDNFNRKVEAAIEIGAVGREGIDFGSGTF
jgi:hypothetical protein